MCDTCGCNVTHGNAHLLKPGGRLSKTASGHEAVSVLHGLLDANDHTAAHNRQHFELHGVLAVNFNVISWRRQDQPAGGEHRRAA